MNKRPGNRYRRTGSPERLSIDKLSVPRVPLIRRDEYPENLYIRVRFQGDYIYHLKALRVAIDELEITMEKLNLGSCYIRAGGYIMLIDELKFREQL